MKDKLRELAGLQEALREAAEVLQMVADSGVKLPPNWRGPLADELSGFAYLLMDAEGDNNSDGLIDCNKCGMTHLYGARTCVHCGSSLYTHPARSCVVSDEDVERARSAFVGADDGSTGITEAMRAALESYGRNRK